MDRLAFLPALDLAAMESTAAALAARLEPGDCVTLRGEVGSGKTTFARALIQRIAAGSPEVTSPTFTLMQSYDVSTGKGMETLWHLDLYRIESEEELEALGLEELWPHMVLIEWPEAAFSRLPETRLDIAFDAGVSQNERALILRGNDAWRERLKGLW